MELRHLRYFLAVAEEKHFGRAAERLHMAQPPLSSQIKQLETELGTTLFERTTRKVELTAAGVLLVDRARQILADVDAAAADVGEIGRGASGVLRVGFSGTATYRLMPEIVRLAREQLPLVRLQVSGEMLTPQMEQALLDNRLDAAVLRPPVQSSELSLDEFEQSPLVAVLPLNHRLAGSTAPVSIAELAQDDVVSYPQGSSVSSVVAELSRQAGFRLRIVQEATETSTLIALVSAGLGVAFVPGSASLPLHSSIALRPLSEDVTLGLGTAWKTGTTSPLLQSFLRLAREASENLHDHDRSIPPAHPTSETP
ncbi:MAG: LysR substrate-binding domain-containing protein [Micrococcaceae bacterium]